MWSLFRQSTVLSSLQFISLLLLSISFASSFGFSFSSKLHISANAKMTTPSTTSLPASKVGFIGCGTIAAAIATGLATVEGEPLVESLSISRRSKAKSEALKARFPDLVTVYDDNQDILDQADIIFITVLPQQASEILQSLKFDTNRHHLVSLVSTAKIDDLVQDSGLDASRVSKMICLPSIAQHRGVCLHCSPTGKAYPVLTNMFHRASSVVTLSTEAEMEAAMVTTCIMGPTYGIMREGRDWLLKNTNMSPQDASYLIIQQFIGAVQDAEHEAESNPNRLDDLIDEQTKGGLNEQALSNLDQLGGLEAQSRVMDATLSRIRGETDGTIGG